MRISDWSSDVCSSDLVRRRALNDLVKVDRADRAGWQIGRGHTLHVLHAAIAHRDGLVPERIAAVLDLVDEGLCVCLQIRRLFLDRLHVDPVDGLGKKRSEEHTSELQSLMRISYAVFCLKKK